MANSALRNEPGLWTANDYLREILLSPVYDLAIETPLDHMDKLSKRLSQRVFIKREDLQPVRSFKLRGAYHKLCQLSEEQRRRGVVAASAGNHAQGVALSAKKLGIKARIVMPQTTPDIKVDAVRRLGAEVILHGKGYDAAGEFAKTLSRESQSVYIAPFDDACVIAGQGTIGRELLQQLPQLDMVFVPVGGGGLIAGIACYLKQLKPELKVIGVEPADANCLQQAMTAGHPVSLPQVGLFADGVAVKRIGDETFRLAQRYVDQVITVSSDAICAATRDIFEDCRANPEPAGALALAGLKEYVKQSDVQGLNLAAVLSGANLNFDTLRYIAERCELGEQKEAVLAVTIAEQKGSFKRFCELLGERTITEFNYRYGAQDKAQIFVGIRLRQGMRELDEVVANLMSHGYQVEDLSDNEMAKLHVRYMVGGKAVNRLEERLYSFEFPEYPGALLHFLTTLGKDWNISLFHYRNHGAAFGQVLAGLEVSEKDELEFQRHLKALGFRYQEHTSNPAYQAFLR